MNTDTEKVCKEIKYSRVGKKMFVARAFNELLCDKIEWKQIDNHRVKAKISGGWLVKIYENVIHAQSDFSDGGDGWIAMTFVSDPDIPESELKFPQSSLTRSSD